MSRAGDALSDVVAAPFQWASALRGRRIFHPSGVLAGGRIERLAPQDQGLPITSCEVVRHLPAGRMGCAVGLDLSARRPAVRHRTSLRHRPFELLAELTLDRELPAGGGRDEVFDPTIHSPQQVRPAPGWLTDLRRSAYDRSREGRDTE